MLKRWVLPGILVALIVSAVACGSSGSSGTTASTSSTTVSTGQASSAKPGKITAKASGISGQDGLMFAVMAYDYDWQPGATGPAVGGVTGTILGNDFSLTEDLRALDAQGQPSEDAKEFDPKEYSVVFSVSDPGAPSQYFTEVRVSVNGDTLVTAQPWEEWGHQ